MIQLMSVVVRTSRVGLMCAGAVVTFAVSAPPVQTCHRSRRPARPRAIPATAAARPLAGTPNAGERMAKWLAGGGRRPRPTSSGAVSPLSCLKDRPALREVSGPALGPTTLKSREPGVVRPSHGGVRRWAGACAALGGPGQVAAPGRSVPGHRLPACPGVDCILRDGATRPAGFPRALAGRLSCPARRPPCSR
jgi:hypothetical protein